MVETAKSKSQSGNVAGDFGVAIIRHGTSGGLIAAIGGSSGELAAA